MTAVARMFGGYGDPEVFDTLLSDYVNGERGWDRMFSRAELSRGLTDVALERQIDISGPWTNHTWSRLWIPEEREKVMQGHQWWEADTHVTIVGGTVLGEVLGNAVWVAEATPNELRRTEGPRNGFMALLFTYEDITTLRLSDLPSDGGESPVKGPTRK